MKLNYRTENNAKFIASLYNKPLDKPDWYKIEALAEDEEANVLLYDYIGWPYNEASEFIRALGEVRNKKITIHINSPGGDVWDGHAIHNAIRSHSSKPITVIDSLAASAASYIAVAGHKRLAHKNAMMMIHEPTALLCGNQYDLRETADILEQLSETMIDMYADASNVGKRDLKDMLKAETWMKAKEALDKGFIDEIIDKASSAKASCELISIYAHYPGANEEPEVRVYEKALRDAGASKNKAKAILAGGLKAAAGLNILDFSHNSTVADDEPDWEGVDKTKLPRVAFADQGEPDKKSTWGYPHHWIKNGGNLDDNGVYTTGTMYLHKGGLNAAWAAANGARSGQEASTAVKNHLQAHRKALGLDDDNNDAGRLAILSLKNKINSFANSIQTTQS